MSNIKLFELKEDNIINIPRKLILLEKSIQTLIEKNMEELFHMTFLSTEYSTGPVHRGRIDSLAIDENFYPVIFEYKRQKSENVVNQGLYYLDWLLDHKAEFQLLVQQVLGNGNDQKIDWSNPRVICVAPNYTKFDIHSVERIAVDIELIKFYMFENNTLMLQSINLISKRGASQPDKLSERIEKETEEQRYYASVKRLYDQSWELQELYKDLVAQFLSLGDDVKTKKNRGYVAVSKMFNIAAIEARSKYIRLELIVKKCDEVEFLRMMEGYPQEIRGGEKPSPYRKDIIYIYLKLFKDEHLDIIAPVLEKIYEIN